jgi:hypothetical protein
MERGRLARYRIILECGRLARQQKGVRFFPRTPFLLFLEQIFADPILTTYPNYYLSKLPFLTPF